MRRRITFLSAAVLLASAMLSPVAPGQTTSPRNLQAPTERQLLAECRGNAEEDKRRECEERVRAGGGSGEGSANKSVQQQQSERPQTHHRAATDSGTSTTPPSSRGNDASARTRSDRTRVSQRSEQIKTAPHGAQDSNPVNSTDAAPTRTGGDNAAQSKREADRETRTDSSAAPSATRKAAEEAHESSQSRPTQKQAPKSDD